MATDSSTEAGGDSDVLAGGPKAEPRSGTKPPDRKPPKAAAPEVRPRGKDNNVLEGTRERPRERASPLEPPGQGNAKGGSNEPASAKPSAAKATFTGTESDEESDEEAIPQSVRDRFVQDGQRFYFPDGHLAFRDYGRRLVTSSENRVVVQGFIEIAQARGWTELSVRGTERFRQEAWRQARAAGLTVQGYRPTDLEQAALERRVAARRAREASAAAASSETSEQIRGEPPSADTSPQRRRARIEGQLLEHGRDAYRHNPQETASYYVRLQTPKGPREVWGQDLERAMVKSLTQPQIGDEIVLQETGREAITVKRPIRDEQGQIAGSREVLAHRNRWVVERRDFFEARARDANTVRDERRDPKDTVREHPALAGTYVTLRAGEITAEQLKNPEDRRRFIALLRDALADEIERGEPYPTIRLRERSPERVQREREKSAAHSLAR